MDTTLEQMRKENLITDADVASVVDRRSRSAAKLEKQGALKSCCPAAQAPTICVSCPNRANKFHECSAYCHEKYGGRPRSVPRPAAPVIPKARDKPKELDISSILEEVYIEIDRRCGDLDAGNTDWCPYGCNTCGWDDRYEEITSEVIEKAQKRYAGVTLSRQVPLSPQSAEGRGLYIYDY